MRIKRPLFWLLLLAWSGASVSYATVTVINAAATPNVINNKASYEIAFAAPGAFPVGSYVEIIFPIGTLVPNMIPAGQITVNGVATTATATGIAYSLLLVSPAAKLPVTNLVVVRINSSINSIVNPGEARADYTLYVLTTAEPDYAPSPDYSIAGSGTVLQAGSVSVVPNTLASNGGYTIDFDTSADGILRAELNQIHVLFPGSTQVPAGALATTALLVNGTEVHAASGEGNTLTVTVDQWIYESTAVTVSIPSSLGLTNPLTARPDYRLIVSTSAQPLTGQSDAYTISATATPLAVGSVSVSPDCAGIAGAYSFTFNTSSEGILLAEVSRVFICFPDTCVVPAGPLSASGIMINGVPASQASGLGNTLTVTIAQDIPAGASGITVALPASLGISNPTSAGSDYHLRVSTSNQTNSGESGAFVITSPPTATATPTSTATPTITVTSTITPTATISPLATVSPTATPSNAPANIDLGGKPFLAFPNPARDKVTFVVRAQPAAAAKVLIYNLAGERVADVSARLGSSPGQSLVWDCRTAASGLYIVHLFLDGKEIGKAKVAVAK